MKILLTGANGRIGSSLIKLLPFDLSAYSRQDLDITDKAAVAKIVNEIKPDAIINCAGIINPRCEENKELAFRVNVTGVENLCDTGVRLVQISSWVVLNPKDWYGITKCAAEYLIDPKKHVILRLAFPHDDMALADAIVKLIDKPGIYNLWELKAPYLKTRLILFLKKLSLKLMTEPGSLLEITARIIKKKSRLFK